MLNVVGLKEAVDLCLAEQRSRREPHVNGTSDEIRATALGKNEKPLKCNLMGSRGGQAGGHGSWCLSSWSMIL